MRWNVGTTDKPFATILAEEHADCFYCTIYAKHRQRGAVLRIVVLFNLRPEMTVGQYEEWVRKTDIPIDSSAVVKTTDLQAKP